MAMRWFNKKEAAPLIVLQRKREKALTLQNSDLDVGQSGDVGGVQRVSLGLRGCRSRSCHLLTVDFEDDPEAPLLCGSLHSISLSAGPDSLTVQAGCGPFSLAMPHVTAAVTRTMPHG